MDTLGVIAVAAVIFAIAVAILFVLWLVVRE
jgi:hypothetical protein